MARIRTTLALALGTLTAFAQLAAAKPKPKGTGGDTKPIDMGSAPIPGDGAATGSDAGGGSGSGSAVEMSDDDKPSADPTGTKENPNAPRVGDDDAPTTVTAEAPPPRRTGYPIEEVLRPITLPQNTSEVAIDLRTAVDHADAEGVLRARYGITRQWQIGLTYDLGGVFSDASPTSPKNKFNTGKAAGIEAAYLITDWVAVRLRVPIYMQPFAMGVTLGAPMKFRFGDRFAITAFDSVVDITTYNKFTPDLTNEASNRALATATMANIVRQDGNLRFIGAAEYQVNPKTCVIGSLGLVEPNFGQSGASALYPLEGILQWSPSNKLDLAGRLGWDSLADASSSFAIRFTAAFRI